MPIKSTIYNHQLDCVAFEILSPQSNELNQDYTNLFYDLIIKSDTRLPLFIPFAFKTMLEQFETPIENPIILKLDAAEIESKYSIAEIEESSYSIALLIHTPQQLAWLNLAEDIGLTEQLMSTADATKVVNFSKSKQRKVIAYGISQPLNFDQCKAMIMDYYCGDFLFKRIEDDSSELAANRPPAGILVKKGHV